MQNRVNNRWQLHFEIKISTAPFPIVTKIILLPYHISNSLLLQFKSRRENFPILLFGGLINKRKAGPPNFETENWLHLRMYLRKWLYSFCLKIFNNTQILIHVWFNACKMTKHFKYIKCIKYINIQINE